MEQEELYLNTESDDDSTDNNVDEINEDENEEKFETFDDVEFECFDTHTHPILDTRNENLIYRIRFHGICIMSEKEEQWPIISSISNEINSNSNYKLQSCVPAFGVHPWRAHQAKPGWEERLIEVLQKHPKAIVGEMGLDKVAKTPETKKVEFESQIKVWEKQLKIAADLNRPVSMHCVQAHGYILEFFRNLLPKSKNKKNSKQSSKDVDKDLKESKDAQPIRLPPIIVLHSYGGSIEIAKSLLVIEKKINTRFYFGFSSCINSKSPKTISVAASIPDDRLLLETDVNSPVNISRSMSKTVSMIAQAKCWTLSHTTQTTLQNSLTVFGQKSTK